MKCSCKIVPNAGVAYSRIEYCRLHASALSAALGAVELAKLAIAFEKAHSVYFIASAREMAELASEFLTSVGVRYWISPRGDSITCVKCRLTSNNPNDVKELYCGHCHEFFTGDGA